MTFPEPSTKPLLRPEELIPFIPSMGRTALYEAIARGEVPSIKIGRRIYVPTAAVRRAWLMDESPSAEVDEDSVESTADDGGAAA